MMGISIGAETARLAGLQIDMLQKLRKGQLTLDQIEWWLNQRSKVRDRHMEPDFRDVVNGILQIVRVRLKLSLDKTFNPSEFMGDGWSVWRGPADGDGLEGDEDCVVFESGIVDFEQIVLETHLEDEETDIHGEEKMRRARTSKNRQLGGRAFLALRNDWLTCKAVGKPEDSILMKLRKAKKIGTVIYFLGLTLRSPAGGRSVLRFYFEGEECLWDHDWVDGSWDADHPSVALASVDQS